MQLTKFDNYRKRCHEVQDILKSMVKCDDVDDVTHSKQAKPSKSVTTARQSQFQCDICNIIFTTKRQLSTHQRVHGPKKSDHGDEIKTNNSMEPRREDEVSEMLQEVENGPYDDTASRNGTHGIETNRISSLSMTIEFATPSIVKQEQSPEPSPDVKETDMETSKQSAEDEHLVDDMITIYEVKVESDEDNIGVTESGNSKDQESSVPGKACTSGNTNDAGIYELVKSENEIYTIQSVQDHQCEVCLVFPDSMEHSRHKRLHKPKKHVCKTCGMSFAIRYNLQRHLQTHVPLSERPKEPVGMFECKLCSKTFKFKHRLRQHLSQVHRPKTLACHICDLKFSLRSVMLRHLRLHTAHGDTKEDFARRQRKQQKGTSGNEDVEGEFSKNLVEVCCDQRSFWCHYALTHQKYFKCSMCDAAFGSR
ncbi:zinc finger protein 836-like [Armigeres subalbatus]|uniref:zinc finger protein 836-like n=1 Tax=Armigeres subalbatus TaxID=124917 RepID=UPI002ED2EC5D